MSNVFKGYQFVLDLDSNFNFKQKKELQKKITNNGGTINASLTNETNFLIVSNTRKTKQSYKGRTAQKNSTPIVSTDFVKRCLKENRVVDTRKFMNLGSEFEEGKIKGKLASTKLSSVKEAKFNFQEIRVWKWGDNKTPEFNEDNYEIAKTSFLLQSNPFEALFYQLELHVIPKTRRSKGNHFNFRVFCHYGNRDQLKDTSSGTKECRYLQSSSEALEVYKYLYNLYRGAPHNYIKSDQFISRWIGSDKQRKISMESSFESGAVSKEVIELIEHIWQEAYEQLNALISLPDANINKTKVDKAEAVLLQIRHILDTDTGVMELKQLSEQFFNLIPLDKDRIGTIQDKASLAKVHDICQLIKDIECVSEATNFSPRNTMQAKFRALHCHVEHLPTSSPEYKTISDLVRSSTESGRNKFDIKNIFAVNRAIEATNFTHHLANKRLLFHASRPANFVGILTRGLLLPKIVIDDFGGQLTDPGNLGSGIYFTDSASTSGKYSSRSKVKGSRFMLVNEVALGKCLDMKSKDYTLSAAPEGYDSVHGVKKTHRMRTHFVDDEFVVYNKNQQRIRYLVEFKLPNDAIKDIIQMSLQEIRPSQDSHSRPVDINLNTIESLKNPMDKIRAGLQSKSNNSVPLTAVHIRAQLIDLTAQVVVLQAYRNDSNVPIEAKYVFPLDDMAAVCGFEAFIDGKHVIGEVKDKEVAHHEYKEAIRKGHGAYLMDEETPDVFTVSVGNLPPNSDVLIKITYVAELGVESGKVMFNLPGSVAPWKKDSALSETTQEQTETLKVSGQPTGGTSIQISILMPYDICSIESPTHPIRYKKSSTNATVELRKNARLEGSGFQLLIQLAEIHVPRMWIERHPDKTNSQACMLTFYPDFESKEDASPEILLFLDMSNSMDIKNQMQAQTIVMLILKHLPKQATFNIITFGTSFNELFPVCQAATTANIKSARTFVACAKANMGNTDLWRPLHSYFLLSDDTCVRNIFLISDGHINNEESTLAAIRLNANCNRVFTFGISATANKHLLKSIARVGTGAFEFFDTSLKSRWPKKIKRQLLKAMQPVLSNVNVEWEQLEDSAPKPIQAPSQITSLFSGSRQVVYGYVPCCRQATLKAEINGEEISTKVSTNELNITRGKILHQLTARAIIRDWEDGTLDVDPVEHDIKKEAQKSYIIDLSKEYSIVTQFTSFIAVEERNKTDFVDAIFKPSIHDLVAKEDVDNIPYVSWEDTLRIEDVQSDSQIPPEQTTEDNLCYSAMEMKIYTSDPMEFAYYGTPESVKIKSKRYRQLRQAACYDFGLELNVAPDLSGAGCMGNDIPPRRGGLNIKAKKRKKPVRFSPEGQYMLKEYALGDCSVSAPTAKALKSKKPMLHSQALTLDCLDLDSVSAPTAKAFSNSKRKMYTKSFSSANLYGESKEELSLPMSGCFDIDVQPPPSPPPGSFDSISDTESADIDSILCGMDFRSEVLSDLVERSGVLSEEKQLKSAMTFKKRKGFSLGFPKRKTNVSEATARYFSLESCSSNAFENRCHFQTDIKSDDEIDFDLLSYYRMENNELALTSAESDAIYHSVQRISSAQHESIKSWRIPCLRELLKLEKLIEEHAQIISQKQDEIETCKSILSTAVVVCLLEYLLVNLVKVCLNGTKIWTRKVYRTAFYSLWEGESYIDKMSKMSKRADCVSMQLHTKLIQRGLTLTEYVEKHILGALQNVPDLDIRSFNFAGSEVDLSAYILKLLWSEFDWESKSFWKFSATFAVIFAIKRRFVVALLERSGIKALDLKLQKKVHFMLAIAIALERFQSSKNLREIKKPIKQLKAWLDESENDNYGLASHLELGQDWRDVASKLCTNK